MKSFWTGLRRRLWVKYVEPLILRCGWRRPHWVRLGDADLQSLCGYDEEADIKQAVRQVRQHTMVSFERLATLWQQVRYLDRCGIAGSLVECGVWRGGSVGLMALAHLRSCSAPTRRLHLFDSFEGLPEPTAEADGALAVSFAGGRGSGARASIGACVGPLEDSRRLIHDTLGYPAALTSYHVGWFEETLPPSAGVLGPIALLRLDGDWYESTRVCLDQLYPHVVPAGVVVIDDYGHWAGCRRAVDEFLAGLAEPVLLHHIDYSGRCWVRAVANGSAKRGGAGTDIHSLP
jgi:hypothetical protein